MYARAGMLPRGDQIGSSDMSSKKGVREKPWTISLITCTDALVQGRAVSPDGEAGSFEIDLTVGRTGEVLAPNEEKIGFITLRRDGSFMLLVEGKTVPVTSLSGRLVRQQA